MIHYPQNKKAYGSDQTQNDQANSYTSKQIYYPHEPMKTSYADLTKKSHVAEDP